MSSELPVSRREFLATSGALAATGLAATSAAAEKKSAADQLALNGGPRAVPESRPPKVRWGEPEREQLSSVVDQTSLLYWRGPQTELVTKRFQQHYPLENVMTCSSGTAAVHIAVAAAGIGPGDEVITTGISDMGTVIGILFQQGVPVFADLGANNYNLDPADVERKITPKTKAIIAVHLSGNPCDMDALKKIAKAHKLALIEDCAQAWGAKYRGQPIGTIGDIACFSLQNSKHITCGDGGIVASSHPEFGPRLRRFGDKGMDRDGWNGLFEDFGTNYRMNELSAAFAAAQLQRLEEVAATRAARGDLLGKELEDVPGLDPHEVDPKNRTTYWSYFLRPHYHELSCDRAEFVKALRAEGVPAGAGYIKVPLYGNPVFQNHGFFAGRWPIREMGLTDMDYSKVSCPETEAILADCVRIIIHEDMSEEYVRNVAAGVKKVTGAYLKG